MKRPLSGASAQGCYPWGSYYEYIVREYPVNRFFARNAAWRTPELHLGRGLVERVIAYVDGFNLYFGLKSKGWQRYYWLDVPALVGNPPG